MPVVKLSANERRRVSAFFTCLLLAGIAWILTTLSNPYNYKLKAVLLFKNAPQKRAYHSLQSDTADMLVKGTGWQMLFSGMSEEIIPITIDLHTLDSKNFVVLSNQVKSINNKTNDNQEIISIYPDTLYFDFSNRSVKKVPVQLISAIKYQRQFAQSGDITVQPAYVSLNGPANIVDKIKTWKTDTLKADSVNANLVVRQSLQHVNSSNLTVYPKSVLVTVPVDEFTEKTISVPVKVLNNTDYYNLKIFPQKVKITFTIALNRYHDTDEELFEATVDLNLWRQNGYSVLPVKLTRFPQYCRIVKIEPQNIDFIIRK